MRVKYFLIVFGLYFIPGLTMGQQQPWYTQYILNNYILNPAVAGIENYLDLEGSYRRQWVGLDGAPVTTYFTAHGSLNPNPVSIQSPTSVPENSESSRGKSYWQNYSTSASHFGVGIMVVKDQAGLINDFSAKVSLAYHVKLYEISALSAGFSFGAQEFTINTYKLNFGPQNPSDPAVTNLGSFSTFKPDLNFGLWYYSRSYFLGASVQQIIPETVVLGNNSTVSKSQLLPEVFFQGGYRFLVTDDINVLPSFNIHISDGAPANFDFNTKIQYRDRVWVSGSYRHINGYSVMAGLNINSLMHIGYSYDFNTSSLFQVNSGTHEIVLSLFLRNIAQEICPRNVW